MWDGLAILLLLSIVMGTTSFLAGSLPLSFSLSQRQLRLVTALGTGVLVGTSLIVIIPEGVETLYIPSGSSHGHVERSVSLAARGATVPSYIHAASIGHEARQETEHVAFPGQAIDNTFRTGPDDGFQSPKDATKAETPSSDPGHKPGIVMQHPTDPPSGLTPESHNPHAWIGISLILGFILMYLIDTLPRHANNTIAPQRFPVSLNNFSLIRAPSISNQPPNDSDPEVFAIDTPHGPGESRPSSTTVGLVIHAAADGIALGASSTGPGNHLSFVVFMALMIHKAPAAFGLTSVLLKQGLSKRIARTHLIVFSLAAPVGALLTWSAVHILGFSSGSLGESASTEFATGVLLLFSGGTFLYVAMHTMQNGAGHEHEIRRMNGYAGVLLEDPYAAQGPPPPEPASTALVDTMVTVGGMLLPLLTQFGHGD
ncbi:hypothetical protein DOTSEDRAFT_52662 [Dothistroma septosporum NZE10]|uniref:Zinc/iron permease n=1 Tax=Dothistroma septosporum (strain NZE10 / CBS 128990) TaxID=675120 RepID=N1PSM5_DOTSN|nr:hypothetical protein DOTSEDRAFT_52662 [Dothistroma septosporum NZE10]